MRPVGAVVGLGILFVVVGCHYGPNSRNTVTRDTPLPPAPKVPQLVEYLNDNARRVKSLRCDRVDINAQADGQRVSLGGMMAFQKPRNFRLKANVVAQPTVDIGSNNDEFWYWISKNDPPHVFHCSYTELAKGVQIPFPFQPDMIVMALGIADYDPKKPYQLKENRDTLELIESTTSPQGQPVQKVTLFNRREVSPGRGQPQVVGYVLKDERGEIICKADIKQVTVNRETGAVLPRKVTLTWTRLKATMELDFTNLQVVNLDAALADRLFSRRDLKSYTSFDLARRVVDSPGPQRASFESR